MPYLSLEKLLSDYFQKPELQNACDEIDEPTSYNSPELITMILNEWKNKGNDKYELFEYLDKARLSRICKAYKIDHKGSKEVLLKRIRKKKLLEQTHSIRNVSIITILFVIGAVASIYGAGLATLDIFDNDGINTDISGDGNTVIIGDGNIVTTGDVDKQLEANYEEISELKQLVKENIENQNIFFQEFGIESQIVPDKKIELSPEIIKQIEDQDQEIKRLNSEIEQLTNEKQQLDLDYSNKIANLQYYSGNYEEYFSTNDQILTKNPHNAVLLNNQAVALSQQGNYTGALYYYDKSLEIDPTKESTIENKLITLSNYGVLLSQQGNYTGAIYYYDKALEIDPNQIQIWVNKGTTLINFEQYPEAISSYYKALEIDSLNDELLSGLEHSFYNYGVSFYNKGDYNDALNYFNKALQINDTNDKTWELREKTLQKIN